MIKTLYPCFQHWSSKGSVWIISDTHFDDSDCQLMDPGWLSPAAHLDRLKHITKNDTLIHLGDVGNPEYLNQLKCYKVLIMGNHDQSKTKFEPYFDEIYGGPLMVGEKILLSHEPINVPWAFNIHGHDHDMSHVRGERDYNLASNVVHYIPYSLQRDFIDSGMLASVRTIHRLTIDYATENPIDKREILL